MVNKLFNMLCSRGISTESQKKNNCACDSSVKTFFSQQEIKNFSSFQPEVFDELLAGRECVDLV